MDEQDITIRRVETVADCVACRDAQRKAWGIVDDSYLIPIATMIGAAHHGGLVLGAFLPSGEAVGLSFAFLGRVRDRWCLYSQLTGVVPDCQGNGLGGRMKSLQREYARSIGLDFIAWAFDPLQAGNASFNLHRLGASAARYVPNMYGPRTDALNLGVPTDRLIAEWPSTPAESRLTIDPAGLPRLVEGPKEPRVFDFAAIGDSRALLVEIPTEIARLRTEFPDRAERWRAAIAGALGAGFAAGYRAIDVAKANGRSFYVLARNGD